MEMQYLDIMRNYRYNFVNEMIHDLYNEQFQNVENFVIDSVDSSVMNEGRFVCVEKSKNRGYLKYVL